MGKGAFRKLYKYWLAKYIKYIFNFNQRSGDISIFRSGNRSEKALKILKEAGYKNVINAGSIDNASSLLNIEIVYWSYYLGIIIID